MIIQSILIQTSSLALKQPFSTALRTVNSIDEVIIILKTKEHTALGSAPATLAVTGDDLAKIMNDLKEQVKPSFLNYEIGDYESAFTKLHALPLCKSALCCMDIALHDLFAKQIKLPLFAYLNGTQRELDTLYTISLNSSDKMLMQARKVFAEGFKKLKIKLDKNLKLDINRILTIHKNIPNAELFLDINQALTLFETKELIKAVKDLPIQLLEQPLQANDIDGMAELTALQEIPILADETVFSLADAKRCIKHHGADLINIKLMKCGGLYEAKKILDYCQKHHIKCMMGCMLESAISVTAALHLSYAYENIIYADLDGPILAKTSLVNGGIYYTNMKLSCHTDTGLGVSLK